MAYERGRLVKEVSDAKQVYLAMQDAQLDAANGAGIPLPADSGAKTSAEYVALLVKGGYLQPSDVHNLADVCVANISKDDRLSANAVIYVSRSCYDALVLGKDDDAKSWFGTKGGVIAHEGGDVEVLNTSLMVKCGLAGFTTIAGLGQLPPRTPALLPP